MATALANLLWAKVNEELVPHMCKILTRLEKLNADDFKIEYYFDDDSPCLRIEIRPLNAWSNLAFKTIHDREIAEEARDHSKTSA